MAAEVLEHLSYAPPPDARAAAVLIAAALADPDRLAYAQRLTATGEFVGTTSFYEIDPENRSLAIGHTWIGRPFWRSAVNSASKLLMLTRAFEGLGAERVVWHTDLRNERSQRAIERLGATREGVLRHHRIRRDGSWRDTVQYSMLSAEWPDGEASADRCHTARMIEMRRDDQASRYEGWQEDVRVCVIDFSRRGDVLEVTHTGTPPQWRGRGFAAELTRQALDDVRVHGLAVRPLCSFTRRYVEEHPEYADLLA